METLTMQAGSLSLTVSADGTRDEEGRVNYAYTIAAGDWEHTGNDLHSGVGATPDVREGMESLASFLSAAAESYAYTMRTGQASENASLFPEHVTEAAYTDSDELDMLAFALSQPPHTGHWMPFTGAWYCDTCDSPYCELA